VGWLYDLASEDRPSEGGDMSRRRFVAATSVCVVIAGCGSGGKVSSASLQHRLLPVSAVPGFALQRRLDWSDPVNLTGQGLSLPQRTRPSDAVKEFTDAEFKGSSGEILTSGSGFNETAATVGVAQFASEADANRVRDWMHSQDLEQPCYGPCVFAPVSVAVPGVASARVVVQSSKPPAPPSPPPGAPRGAKSFVAPSPTNYLAEFTIGPYLYWAILHADSTARTNFERGLALYYRHAKES
jgi:hypothetical protein